MSLSLLLKRAISYILHGTPIVNITAGITYTNSSEILKGKRIIITGGSRGLGLAMAKKCIEEGAIVLITGRNEDSLKKISKELGCKYSVLDIRETKNFNAFIEQAQNELGAIDGLINNAGISLHEATFFDVNTNTFDDQIATNLRGPYFLTQSYINYLLKHKLKGNILFISSEAGETVDYRPYGYTKAATNSIVKGLANLFRKEGIRINAIAPGVTVTDMTGVASNGNLYAGDYGEGRYYLPQEIAEVASFLLSDTSGCISGQIITCNNAQTVNPRWK